MLELQNGHIVCLNSVLALSAIPGAIDYCTSKASAFAFMESLTLGLLDCPGVSATTVLPFHTSTEMFQGMRVRSVSRGRPAPKPSPAAGRARTRRWDAVVAQGLAAQVRELLQTIGATRVQWDTPQENRALTHEERGWISNVMWSERSQTL